MNEEPGFTVRDRRRADGDTPKDTPEAEPGPSGEPSAGPSSQAAEGSPDAGPLPEMDFATFILSLASTAQISLGSIPHPETGEPVRNIPAAKEMIDIIALLQEKTKGNLTSEEERLVEQVLYSLRLHYIRTVEEQKKSGG